MNIIQKLRIEVDPVNYYGSPSVQLAMFVIVNGVEHVHRSVVVEDHFKGFFDQIWQQVGEEVKRQCTKPLDSPVCPE